MWKEKDLRLKWNEKYVLPRWQRDIYRLRTHKVQANNNNPKINNTFALCAHRTAPHRTPTHGDRKGEWNESNWRENTYSNCILIWTYYFYRINPYLHHHNNNHNIENKTKTCVLLCRSYTKATIFGCFFSSLLRRSVFAEPCSFFSSFGWLLLCFLLRMPLDGALWGALECLCLCVCFPFVCSFTWENSFSFCYSAVFFLSFFAYRLEILFFEPFALIFK